MKQRILALAMSSDEEKYNSRSHSVVWPAKFISISTKKFHLKSQRYLIYGGSHSVLFK